MPDTQTASHEQAVVDVERGWAICRCGNGCIHVTLDRFMVTLTDAEFQSLMQLMQRACDRFHSPVADTAAFARSH